MQASPKLTKNFSPKEALPTRSNVIKILPSDHQIQLKCQTSVPCCLFPKAHLSSPYLPYCPKVYLATKHTFTRRTSGHCLRTFRAVNFFHPYPPVTSVVGLTSSPSLLHLLPLLTFFMLQSAKQEQSKWKTMSYLNHKMSERNQSALTHDSARKIIHPHNNFVVL